MYLSSLRLFNFRNLKNQTVSFGDGLNVIVGKNGQGKTNLIEAVSLLSHTKSFRTSKRPELVQWDQGSCSVFGHVRYLDSEFELGFSIEKGVYKAYLNGDEVKSISDYLGKLVCVSFTPSDLSLVKGAPGLRRRFIDKHGVDLSPGHLNDLIAYQRALRSKNQVLKDLLGCYSTEAVEKLQPWNELMADFAQKITSFRVGLIAELSERSAGIYSKFASEKLRLELNSKMLNAGQAKDKSEIVLELEAQAAREVQIGNSTLGPHRDDVDIYLDGKEARLFASQGQTRSIVLALKLAILEMIEERLAEAPLILLDDVDSELDQHRSEALFSLVLCTNRQVLITGTERGKALLGCDDVKELSIENGEILG